MNNRQILEDVYKDFFPEKKVIVEEEKLVKEEVSLDSLYITDE